MAYWLLKSEPETWSWAQQVAGGVEPWDGVRNYQARNYMMQMAVGDKAFFYHSGKERAIVGAVEIVKEAYPEPEDPRFVRIDVATDHTFEYPVRLTKLKSHPELQDIALIRQSRLSVMPISKDAWRLIWDLGMCKEKL